MFYKHLLLSTCCINIWAKRDGSPLALIIFLYGAVRRGRDTGAPHALYRSAFADFFQTQLCGMCFKMESPYPPVSSQLPVLLKISAHLCFLEKIELNSVIRISTYWMAVSQILFQVPLG